MTKAFLYDFLCGKVFQCMFAGLDKDGHAQWVNITPGEGAMTMKDIEAENLSVDEEEQIDNCFLFLSLEDETAKSQTIAKVLGRVLQFPFKNMCSELGQAVCRMRQLGVKWDSNPLELTVTVMDNKPDTEKYGYALLLTETHGPSEVITIVPGFNDLSTLFKYANFFFMALEGMAEIPILKKTLLISDESKATAEKRYLREYNSVYTN